MQSINSTLSNTSIPANSQVWYITGATSGIGLSIATLLLNYGAKVTGTTRDIEKISKLEIFKNPNFLGLQVDILDSKQVKESIEKTIKHFGGLTHVINNAGYGIIGAIEETSQDENRALMDALYFGPLNVINASLPYLRSKKEGYIFNVSSIAGFRGFASFGPYSAAKFALSGMSEALADELLQFNIKVGCIYLGYVPTTQTSMSFAKNLIPVYQTREGNPLEAMIAKQTPGDANKVAQVIYEYGLKTEFPVNIFLGTFETFYVASEKVKQLTTQIELQKERNSNVVLELLK